ncbi:hypothetical protein FJZ53_06630 [Candidatus Woesearchaeota archaeon]|nr:hypothetical protein [Candidatus Woesearchaeota archaeon]
MGSERARCEKCGFEQERIFRWSFGGANVHFMYGCSKCKKIISHKSGLQKCPYCGAQVHLYEKSYKEKFYLCPRCGEKKLKFYIQSVS